MRVFVAGGTGAVGWHLIPARGRRAGDSAGGGLATVLLVATRDAGEALPAAAVLMSPTADLTSSGASMTERAGQDPIPPSADAAAGTPGDTTPREKELRSGSGRGWS